MGERKYDYEKLTKAQFDGLCAVAFPTQDYVQLHRKTAESLLRRGLIVLAETSEDQMTIIHHVMTIPQHMAFCEWCAKQPDSTLNRVEVA